MHQLKISKLIICLSLISSAMGFASSFDEYKLLDNLAIECETDKCSQCHNYTEVYSKYLAPFKDKKIKFLEIGIYTGCSVKLWEKYFSQAELHFMDITFEHIKYHTTRSTYHLGDQQNPADLFRIMNQTGGDFDVIIDDGGHAMQQQITSFKVLFPYVKSGGLYIIEDLHTSYWDAFKNNNKENPNENTTITFLKSLIDDVNFIGAKTHRASHAILSEDTRKSLNMYQKDIFGIHFYDSMAIIIKR